MNCVGDKIQELSLDFINFSAVCCHFVELKSKDSDKIPKHSLIAVQEFNCSPRDELVNESQESDVHFHISVAGVKQITEEKFGSLCKLLKFHLIPSKQIDQDRGTLSEYIINFYVRVVIRNWFGNFAGNKRN